jgi:hypothetical protein
MGEIHMPKDWSHEEQVRHIRSCPLPDQQSPFAWIPPLPFLVFYAVLLLMAVGMFFGLRALD